VTPEFNMATEKSGADHINQIDDGGLDHLKNVDLHDKVLANAALDATAQEHSYGVIQGLKTYKRAALWSICKPFHLQTPYVPDHDRLN
jgi:SP family general alpha glucoside:H+ symporter-like MFS transporter